MSQRAVSSFSLKRTLGGLSLLDLPAALKAHGYDTLQLCHFHLPSREPAYLEQLRTALVASDITLDAILVDAGDLTSEDPDRDEAWIGGWLDVAVALGAKRARVGAGESSPTPELLQASAERLARLAATHPDVRVVTENWKSMLPDADSTLDPAGGRRRWRGPDDRPRQLDAARTSTTSWPGSPRSPRPAMPSAGSRWTARTGRITGARSRCWWTPAIPVRSP